MSNQPVLLWFRRDLRLADQPAVLAAVAGGRPVVPVFILDETTPGAWAPGGASRWWLHHSLAALTADLRARGSDLVLRRGPFAVEIPRLMAETGAAEIHTGVAVEPWARRVIDDLARSLPIRRHMTSLLFHPEEIRTGSGTPYGVFTPFSRACRARVPQITSSPAPARINSPALPRSDRLSDWALPPMAPDWASGLRATHTPGEAGALARLTSFLPHIDRYHAQRDIPGIAGTSMLSPHLAWGEIAPGTIWERAAQHASGRGLEVFHNEMLWREFSAHLLWHAPSLPDAPLKPAFAAFPWRSDPVALRAWQRGRTGVPIVDAGMRELWHTGWMHNRVRMITASFLIKHLLLPWQDGEAWFWDTLVDADLPANAASWQWVAGSGADAAPFFRIFNPVLQGLKFDPEGTYVRRWVPEIAHLPNDRIHAPWDSPSLLRNYRKPIIDLAFGRQRALDALQSITKSEA